MKKRNLKRSVYMIFLIIILLIVGIVILSKNQKEKNVENSKDSVNETVNQEVEKTNEKRMSLIAVGDVLIHEAVFMDAYNRENDTYNFHDMFTEIGPIIKKYDLKFCNQESIIGGRSIGISGYPSFNAPEEIGDELVNLGFNLISLANNHTMDKGEDAVLYSNSYWKSKDVITAGSYSNNDERNKVKIYEQNGIKYAFLAYVSTAVNGGNPKKEYLLNVYSEETVKNDIELVKDQVDVIIVSMHWAEKEGLNTVDSSQKEIANYLSSLGVNIIIGHHPHVVQPVEYVNDTLVIYSLGNFISNQLVVSLNNAIGLMYGIDIVVSDDKVTFENEYKELIFSYSDSSTNFKVIPFSKLNNDLLNNYESIETQYMNIVTGGE